MLTVGSLTTATGVGGWAPAGYGHTPHKNGKQGTVSLCYSALGVRTGEHRPGGGGRGLVRVPDSLGLVPVGTQFNQFSRSEGNEMPP